MFYHDVLKYLKKPELDKFKVIPNKIVNLSVNYAYSKDIVFVEKTDDIYKIAKKIADQKFNGGEYGIPLSNVDGVVVYRYMVACNKKPLGITSVGEHVPFEFSNIYPGLINGAMRNTFNNMEFTDDQFKFSSYFFKIGYVNSFKFSRCSLNDNMLFYLIGCNFEMLEKIDLSYNNISDAAADFFKSVKIFPSINEINLIGTKISNLFLNLNENDILCKKGTKLIIYQCENISNNSIELSKIHSSFSIIVELAKLRDKNVFFNSYGEVIK